MNRICAYLFHPFKVINTNKADFFVLIAFTFVVGQFGIIVNFILRSVLTSNTIQQSMFLESNSGSFYTFAIALVASCLSPIIANFRNKKKAKFLSIKVVTAVLAILFLIFSGIFYAAAQVKQLQPLTYFDFSVDWLQATVYFMAIFFMVYSYCLMKIDSPDFDHLDDPSYDQVADENIKNAISQKSTITDDGTGVVL